MGFRQSTKVLQITEKYNTCIEIQSSDQNEDAKQNKVNMDCLIYKTLSELPADITINFCNISDLQLSRCKLTDLSINLGLLNLKQLNLSHNELTEVPSCLYSGLKYLEDLNLSHNLISSFNREPEGLITIKKIKLNNNCFESLPKWVLMFKSINLEELNFSTNKAVHYKYLKNNCNLHIMRLKKLKLRNSHLIDNDFGFLKCFEQLQYLDISNKHNKSINKLYEIEELFVKSRWRQIEVLKMNNLSLALFPESITCLGTLTEVHINNNCISWLPRGIELMVNLVVLDVSRNHLVFISDELTKLVALEVLQASNNYIEYVPNFTLMPALRVLDLYDNLVEEVSYNHESMRGIDLENNFLDTLVLLDPHYAKKRDEMRRQNGLVEWRINEPKIRKCEIYDYCRDYESVDDEESETSSTGDVACEYIETNDAEDWDSPTEETARNPNIDSVDQEWKGFEDTNDISTINVTEEVDEDWMFVDVD